MPKLAIYGASAPDVVRLVNLINKETHIWHKVVFIDDQKFPHEKFFMGMPIVGNKNSIETLKNDGFFFINNVASSITSIRKVNEILINHNVEFAQLIAPNVVTENVTIGRGVMIYPNVYLGCDVKIGDYTMIRANTTINNNVEVGNFCFFSVGVHIGGRSIIEDYCYFGIGSLLRDNLLVGSNCTIGMGAVVVKSIANNLMVYGNPAKRH